MKIRLGYVGNSSSSSFITGLATFDKNTEVIKTIVSSLYGVSIHKINWDQEEGVLIENMPSDLTVARLSKIARLFLDSFTGEMADLTIDKSDKYLLVANYEGNEGDECFQIDEGEFLYDDIDENFFSNDDIASRIIKIFSKEDPAIPCKKTDLIMGAGRNR
jgi:hypothetical protein